VLLSAAHQCPCQHVVVWRYQFCSLAGTSLLSCRHSPTTQTDISSVLPIHQTLTMHYVAIWFRLTSQSAACPSETTWTHVHTS
jgi:hypothetical protein